MHMPAAPPPPGNGMYARTHARTRVACGGLRARNHIPGPWHAHTPTRAPLPQQLGGRELAVPDVRDARHDQPVHRRPRSLEGRALGQRRRRVLRGEGGGGGGARAIDPAAWAAGAWPRGGTRASAWPLLVLRLLNRVLHVWQCANAQPFMKHPFQQTQHTQATCFKPSVFQPYLCFHPGHSP